MYVPFYVKIQPTLMEQWVMKATKVCKIQTKLIIIWPAHGHHAWLRDFCPSDRFAQDWDDFTHYPVMPWVYVLEQLGASHMVTTQGDDPEQIKDKSRFSSTPNQTS